MASTIAAITTGTGGVVTTADVSGNLSLLSGATTIVAVTATGASVTGNSSVSGVTTVQAGTAALPAITTSGDTNTGIFFPTADTISLTNAGVESARITSSGALLVGTTSQIGSAKASIYSGVANATTYTTTASTGGSSLYIQQQQTISVSITPVVILTPGLYGSLCLIHGSDGTNRFQDLLMFGLGTSTVNVISSLAIAGTPSSRTYSQSSSTYRVAMGSGTYTVQVAALSMSS